MPKDQVGTESSYKWSEQSFICSHLKIVDIKCEEVDGRVQETLEILSTYYGIPLEHVNIQQTDIMASGPWCELNTNTYFIYARNLPEYVEIIKPCEENAKAVRDLWLLEICTCELAG